MNKFTMDIGAFNRYSALQRRVAELQTENETLREALEHLKQLIKFNGDNANTTKMLRVIEKAIFGDCVCHETSTRNCPVHANGEKEIESYKAIPCGNCCGYLPCENCKVEQIKDGE